MVAQAGKDILIKVSDDGTSGGTMNPVAGLRSKSINLNAQAVDVTTADSANRWRELLAGAGVRSAEVSGSGVFNDSAVDEVLRGHYFGGTHAYCQVIIPDFGTLAGLWHVGEISYDGDHDGEAAYQVTLSSAGEITFTAA